MLDARPRGVDRSRAVLRSLRAERARTYLSEPAAGTDWGLGMRGRAFLLTCLWVLAGSPLLGDAPARPQTPGTRRMVARLAELAARNDTDPNPFSSAERVKLLLAIPAPAEPDVKWRHDLALGMEMLYGGQTKEALPRLQELWDHLDRAPAGLPPAHLAYLHEQLAVGYLRLGEQENCIRHHGTESCLLPIRGTGIHAAPRGSRAAIREYTAILQAESRRPDLALAPEHRLHDARRVPGQGAAAWLIPPRVFESGLRHQALPRRRPASGLDVRGLAGRRSWRTSTATATSIVILSSMGLRDPLHLLPQPRRRHLRGSHRGSGARPASPAGSTSCTPTTTTTATSTCFVLRGAWLGEHGRLPDSLLRNNGDGTFDDVTEEAGLLSFHPTQTGAWGDYDNDGWLDLFIGNETTAGRAPHPCELFHNNGDGTFTDVAAQVGLASRASSRARCAATTTTTGATRSVRLGRSPQLPESAVPQRRAGRGGAAGASPTSAPDGRRARAAASLPDLVLRLRQRRLARPLRLRLQRRPRATSPPTTSASRTRARSRGSTTTSGDGTFADVTPRGARRQGAAHHGLQLRRPRQRRLARLLRRHRRPRLSHAHPQPHVPQRRREGASRT